MNTNRRRLSNKKRVALTNAQRSSRRRSRLRQQKITEVGIETSFVEKELLKRLVVAAGYNGLSEYVIMRAIEHAAEFGITPEQIYKETAGDFAVSSQCQDAIEQTKHVYKTILVIKSVALIPNCCYLRLKREGVFFSPHWDFSQLIGVCNGSGHEQHGDRYVV